MYTNRKLTTMFSVGLVFIVMGGLALLIHPSPTVTANNPQSQFAGGSGTAEDPYLVATAEHLNNVRHHLTAHFRQIADINLGVAPWNEGQGWAPVGNIDDRFTGSFDGNGYIIHNLTINRPAASYQGLFGDTINAFLRNMQLENVAIQANGYTGGLAGRTNDTAIDNVSVTGQIIAGASYSGGLIGKMDYGVLHNAVATVDIAGWDYTGGLVGSNFVGEIRSSYTTGLVQGRFYVGGLVGYASHNPVIIIDSYSRASVTGANYVGGLVGYFAFSGGGSIRRSYSVGQVTGAGSDVGGLIGSISGVTVANSYWDIESSGQTTSAAGEGRTTAQMKQQETYRFYNFFTLWHINQGQDYPVFQDLTAYEQPQPVTLDELGGSGAELDPYIITTPDELNAIRQDLEAHYRLGNDIDMAASVIWDYGRGWRPIGDSTADNQFTGSFDGNGYTIRNLSINRSISSYQGLFGDVRDGSLVNLHLENVNIQANGYTGGLAGRVSYTTIDNVSVTGQIVGGAGGTGSSYSGGLIGKMDFGSLRNAVAVVDVVGRNYAGGLLGNTFVGNIGSAYAMGSVEGAYYVGGLAGYASHNPVVIANSYSRAVVKGIDQVGGLLGGFAYSGDGVLRNSYSAGPVDSSGSDVGGLVGYVASVTVELSYWDVEASGQAQSVVGNGRTTDQMTYPHDGSTYVGWDFLDAWASDTTYARNGGYPYLQGLTPLPVSITVTAVPAEGGSVTGGGTHEYGRIVTVRAIPAVDWVFVEWRNNGQVVSRNAGYTFTAVEDQALTAYFVEAPDPYQTIGLIPTGGGSIFSEIDQTTYQFAPGTFTGTVRFTHTHVPAPPTSAPEGMADVGYNFVVTAVYSHTNQPAQPAVPVAITIRYGAAGYGGSGPLSLWWLSGSVWTQLDSTDDPVQQTLTATIPHFSQFALFNETEQRLFLPLITR